jgi:nucleotidyltransferase/DNA polymerase involved in DNA repair
MYLCLEFDQFPAQVAVAYNQALEHKAFVVVRQTQESHKSTVWACSQHALQLGVKPGMFLFDLAKKNIPIEIIRGSERLINLMKDDLITLLEQFTPEYTVSPHGTCILNITATPLCKKDPESISQTVRKKISQSTHMQEMCIGIGSSKLIAKLMARLARPSGTQICTHEQELTVLPFLHTQLLPGISPLGREKLKKYGLQYIGQVQKITKDNLIIRFGAEGEKIYGLVQGIFSESIQKKEPCIEAESVFQKDITDMNELLHEVRYCADQICFQLKQKKCIASKICVIIRYTDNRTSQHTAVLSRKSDDFISIAQLAMHSFMLAYTRRVGIRSLLVSVKKTDEDSCQLNLFDTQGDIKQRN